MKFNSTSLLIIILLITIKAKPQEVTTTNGDYKTFAKGSVSFTLGEVFTETFNNHQAILTQGFQQPNAEQNSTLFLKLFLEGLFNPLTNTMSSTMEYDINNDDFFTKFTYPIVDTLSVLIRSTLPPDYNVLAEYHYLNLYDNGNIPNIVIPKTIKGHNYIVISHRYSIETWSDSVNLSNSILNYNFYSHPPSTIFSGNLNSVFNNGVYEGSLIWTGDLNQDGIINIFDLSDVFDALNDPNSPMGYFVEDVNGDGIINIFDLSIVFDNVNLGASSINPFTMKKKK